MQRDIKQLVYALLLKGRAFLSAFRNPPVIGEPFRNQLPARPELDAKIKRLITKSWGPYRNGQHKGFAFAANLNTNANSLEQYTTALLHHIRRVAPTLNVPWLTPRVTITSLTSAAGRFVEEDGWVRIEVDQNFLLKPAAAKAILCHEVCHYVLHASGIREAGTDDNERLTDVAIFVLGLGEVFISGYRSNPGMAYRQGHRLGYLTDGEYHYARNEVNRLRTTGELQQDETSELRQRLMNRLLGDGRKLTRYLEAAHQKFPLYNEAELLKAVEDDLDRGR